MKCHFIKSASTQRGFTLIEVLVAVIVLSIGLLGLAGLQATGLRYNHSAYLRSQASQLAYDIADRMRANRDEAMAGSYDTTFGATPTAGSSLSSQDLVEWKRLLGELLPEGAGSINTVPSGNQAILTIRIRWDDSHGQETPELFTFVTQP